MFYSRPLQADETPGDMKTGQKRNSLKHCNLRYWSADSYRTNLNATKY